jgi:hypothetical protein
MSATLISGDLAAIEVDVSPATIRTWVQLGHLAAAGRQGRRLLYRRDLVPYQEVQQASALVVWRPKRAPEQ